MANSDIKKMIIIGVDGATFDVIDPYIEQGEFNGFQKISENGSRSPLCSSIPPVTGPSWVSFMTGKNPGKHGIFDFVKPAKGEIKRRPVTFKHIKSKTIWHLVSEQRKKVGVINMPLTYPPPEINGFFITGLLTPSGASDITYPAELMDEVKKNAGPYTLDVWWQYYGEKGVEKFFDDMLECTRQRIKVMDYLMDNKEWDLFMPVFIGSDRIQHYLWQYIHPADPANLTKREQFFTEKIKEYFLLVDGYINKIIDRWENDANIIVISDHGFGPLTKKMYINRWLEENQYLFLQKNRHTHLFLKKWIMKLKRFLRQYDKLNLRKYILPFARRGGRASAYDFLNVIDWTQTRAYSASNTEQGIYLNLQGREPDGIVAQGEEYKKLRSEIIEELRKLKDPETGEPVISHIYTKEELYNGPLTDNAPDIIFFVKEGEYLADVQLKDRIFEDANWTSGWGTHRLHGILMGYGPDIRKKGNVQNAHIMDLAPTILRLMNIPVPSDMDGKILEGMIEEDFLRKHPTQYSGECKIKDDSQADNVLSDEDTQEIEKRLKGLGYI